MIITRKRSSVLVNFLLGHVTPEYHAGAEHEVDRGGRFRAVDDGGHLAVVQRYLPYVVLHGEQQGRVPFHGLAPGVVLRVSQVALHAFALERALLVDARLRTAALDIALVYVWKSKNRVNASSDDNTRARRDGKSWFGKDLFLFSFQNQFLKCRPSTLYLTRGHPWGNAVYRSKI